MAIKNYTPENSATTLHILSGFALSLSELIEQAKAHFGQDISLDDLNIRSEKIHTRCITYDLYDGADWDDYLIIERKEG